MNDELLFNNKKYFSSKHAGEISGYTNDYVARLARQGRVEGKKVGRTWYVEESSLQDFIKGNKIQKTQLHKKLADKRVDDYKYSERDRKLSEDFNLFKSKVSLASKTELFKKSVAFVTAITFVFGGYFLSNTDIVKAGFNKVSQAVVSSLNAVSTFDPAEFGVASILALKSASKDVALNVRRGMDKTKPLAEQTSKTTYLLARGDKNTWDGLKNKSANTASNASVFINNKLTSSASGVKNVAVNSLESTLNIFAPYKNMQSAQVNVFASIVENINTLIQKEATYVYTSINNMLCNRFFGFRICGDDREVSPRLVGSELKDIDEEKIVVINQGPRTIINQPVIERIVETREILTVGGITRGDMELAIQQLRNKVYSDMSNLTSANETRIINNYTNVSAPTNKIDKLGSVNIYNSTITNSSFSGTSGTFSGSITASSGSISGNFTVSGDLTVDTNTLYVDSTNNRVGIGTTSPLTTFSVAGDGYFDGNITASNITATGTVAFTGLGTDMLLSIDSNGNLTSTSTPQFASFIATSTTATSTIAGGLNIDSGGFVYDFSSNNAWFNNGSLGIGTTSPAQLLSVSGNTYITGGLGIGVATTAAGVIETSGNVTVGGNLYVVGDATIIGDTSSDTLSINSSISSNLIPDINATRDLGSPAFYWDDVYVDNLVANNISAASTTISGTQNESFTINSDNATSDTEDMNLIFFRGTASPNALITWDSTNDIFDFNQPIFIQNDSIDDLTKISLDIKGTTGQTADLFRIASSTGDSYLVVDSFGNLGIGQTTPLYKLDVTGLARFTGLVDASHFIATTTATSTLAGGLTIAGQCVTGDTRLRRRRRRKKKGEESDEDYIYDEVAIKDIKEGDEIQSLDEKTGELVWSKVNKLMYMGNKPIYKITTASGKSIRTTENHPYFVYKGKRNSKGKTIAFVDYANIKAWLLDKKKTIDLNLLYEVLKKVGVDEVRFYYGTDTKNSGSSKFLNVLIKFGYTVITKPVQYFKTTLLAMLERERNQRWIKELAKNIREKLLKEAKAFDALGAELLETKANFDVEITQDMLRVYKDCNRVVLFSGDGDFASLVNEVQGGGTNVTVVSGHKMLANLLRKEAEAIVHMELFTEVIPNLVYEFTKQKPAAERQVFKKCTVSISDIERLSRVLHLGVDKQKPAGKQQVFNKCDSIIQELATKNNGMWTKVADLREGAYIAITKDNTPIWDKITKIEKLSAEDVYDIEVAGTHNFIGNDIVAHNTYLSGLLDLGGNNIQNAGTITGTNFVATSSTSSIFPYASTTALTVSGSMYIGSITGALQAINGLVSASSSLSSAFIENVYLRNDANDTTTGILTASSYLSTGSGTSTMLNLWASQFQAGSFIQTPYFNATSSSATSTIAGGLAIETSGFVYDFSTNNVGIGTSAPTQKLEVVGGIKLGTVSTCDAEASGTMRYDSGALEVCNGTAWLPTAGSPLGTISAFNSSCPSGWSELTEARGRTIIGAGAGAGLTTRTLGETGGEEDHILTTAELASHSHTVRAGGISDTTTGGFPSSEITVGKGGTYDLLATTDTQDLNSGTIQSTGSSTAFNVMQPFLALTWCEKTTAGPEAIGSITNLNDLANVSIAAPTDGQILIYDNGAGKWAPGNTFSGSIGIGAASAINTELFIRNTNAGDYDTQIGFQLASGVNTFTMGIDDSDGDKFKISTTALGTNDRLTIDSSGNIGIGTSTPYSKLSIWGSGTGTASLFELTNSASTTIMRVLENGSVGIGTTSPWGLLAVNPNGILGPSFVIGSSTKCVTGDTRLRRRRRRKDVLGDDDFEEDEEGTEDTTENTALANGASYSALRMMRTKFVPSIIANVFGLSSEKDASVDNEIIQPAKGLEPSERKVTNLTPHHVTGLRKLYHKGVTYIADNEYLYDETRIDEVEAGDEIQSLDTKTGALVWSKVKQLAYMGNKPIFKLTTASGKNIRTTGNHPYLVRTHNIKPQRKTGKAIAFVDYANIKSGLRNKNLHIDLKVLIDALEMADEYDTIVLFSGDGDFVPLVDTLRKHGKRVVIISSKKFLSSNLRNASDDFITMEWFAHVLPCLTYETNLKPAAERRVLKNCTLSVSDREKLSRLFGLGVDNDKTELPTKNNGMWTKVSDIKEGQYIAARSARGDNAVWDRIINIESLPQEDVYDIEIENTHNFIGNDIVAHNTAFIVTNGGNVGIGTVAPGYPLHVIDSGENIVRFESSDDIATLSMTDNVDAFWMGVKGSTQTGWIGPNNVPGDGISVDLTNGNVGIGTTTALSILDIYGDLSISGANRYINFGTTTVVGTNGYGIRDNAGTLQFKASGGSWADFGSGGSSPLTTKGDLYTYSTENARLAVGTDGQVLVADSGEATGLKWADSSGGIAPSFSVHKNGSNQTVTDGVQTKLTWPTEVFDTNSNFADDKYTPTVAGKYLYTAGAYCADNTTWCQVSLYKNGIEVVGSGVNLGAVGVIAHTSHIIDMNGTTDYVEVYALNVGGTTIGGALAQTNFTGSRIDGGNGLWTANNRDLSYIVGGVSIGTTTSSGVFTVASSSASTLLSLTQYGTGDILNINDGATEVFTILDGGFVGIGTTTPWGLLSINPDGISGPSFVIGSSTQTDFIVTNGGRVGIGTASITANTAVEINTATQSYGGVLRLKNRGTSGADVFFLPTDNTFGDGADKLHIGFGATDTSNAKITLLSGGNVGIGTTDPGAKLHIKQSASGFGNGLRIERTTNGTDYYEMVMGGTGMQNEDLGFYKSFGTAGYTMVLDRSGNVGIGTTNVDYKLEVNGTAGKTGGGSWSDSSDERLKTNIIPIANGLERLLRITPVAFDWKNPYLHGDVISSAGFLAQDVQEEFPSWVHEINCNDEDCDLLPNATSTTLSLTLPFEYDAMVVSALKELNTKVDLISSVFDSTSATTSTSTILSLYQGTTTPAIVIDADGNVGIGTTSPEYKVHVIGDIAATAFVNISTRTSKKDITYITDEEKGTILEELKAIDVAQYRYKYEDESAPLRLGLIAEEAPSDVLSVSGKGVDIYKLVTFTIAGVQELIDKVGDLEVRLADVEAQSANWRSGDSGASLQSVIDYLVSVGVRFVEGVTHIASLVVENLTIGSAAAPNGITLYDEATGEPYCIKMLNGSLASVVGACADSAQVRPELDTATSTPDGSDTEAPIITINGNNPANINIGDTYSDLGATVTDNENDNLGITTYLDGVEVAQISLNTASSTTYTIDYTATDQAGNTATSTRTVLVTDPNADTTAPTITLTGTTTVSILVGDTFTDEGATASDPSNSSGQATDLTDQIVVTGSVDTAVAGTYTLTYDVSDIAGNNAIQVTRIVTVEEVTVAGDDTATSTPQT